MLRLVYNKRLQTWAPDAWLGLSGLERLTIGYGDLTAIPRGAFASLAQDGRGSAVASSLRILDLQGQAALRVWEEGWSDGLPPDVKILLWAQDTPSRCTRSGGVDSCECAAGLVGGERGFCVEPSGADRRAIGDRSAAASSQKHSEL